MVDVLAGCEVEEGEVVEDCFEEFEGLEDGGLGAVGGWWSGVEGHL